MTYPNPEQRQVLDHLHGTLLVLAPAGTGKTRLMADRLAAVIAAGIGSATLRTLLRRPHPRQTPPHPHLPPQQRLEPRQACQQLCRLPEMMSHER